MFLSVIARRSTPSFNLKLVQAKMRRQGRRVDFKPVEQTFIGVMESTANINLSWLLPDKRGVYSTERNDRLNHGTECFLKLKLAAYHCCTSQR